MSGETELVISGDGMPATAVRGITETLAQIDGGIFQKYRLTLSCSDMNSPAIDALWAGDWRRTVNGDLIDLSGIGSTVTVDCISELCYAAGSPASGPRRTVVSGSSRTVDGFVFYRPQLTMGVVAKSQQTDEYGAVVGWQIDLEEI